MVKFVMAAFLPFPVDREIQRGDMVTIVHKETEVTSTGRYDGVGFDLTRLDWVYCLEMERNQIVLFTIVDHTIQTATPDTVITSVEWV